jgi:hypothetical protein
MMLIHPAQRLFWLALAAVLVCAACGKKPAPARAAPAAEADSRASRRGGVRPVGHAQPVEARAAAVPAGEQHRVVVAVTIEGVPAPAASVVLQAQRPRRQPLVLYQTTDVQGVAQFFLPEAAYRVSVSAYADDYATVTMTTNLPARARRPLTVTINLSEPGVLITAGIIASAPFVPSNMQAHILSLRDAQEPALRAARATNAQQNLIHFPPIRRGLRGLCVELRNAGMPVCRSEEFDTLDGNDKTVLLDLPERARLLVFARTAENLLVTSLYLRAMPQGTASTAPAVAGFVGALAADAAGTFVCDTLAPATYLMTFNAPGCQPLTTNIVVGAGDTPVELTLRALRLRTLRGRTIMYDTGAPVSNVSIVAQAGPQQTGAAVTTDEAGCFTCEVGLKQDDAPITLTAARADLSTATVTIPPAYNGEEIVIEMRPAARIVGHVRTARGAPVAGVVVVAVVNEALKQAQGGLTNATRSFSAAVAGRAMITYGGRARAPSDAEGFYVIEQVAAPEDYKLQIIAPHCFVPNDEDPRVNAVAVRAAGEIEHDITVMLKTRLYVKALDEEQQPVQQYELHLETFGARGQGARQVPMDHQGREWLPVQVENRLCYPGVKVSLYATTETAASEPSALLDVCGAASNYVTLVLVPGTPAVAGHVLLPDGTPAAGVRVNASASKSGTTSAATTDALGYFEVHGLTAAEKELLSVRANAWQYHATAQTNVLNGTLNVVLLLSAPRTVTGNVCYDAPGNPATNFTVSLVGGGGRKVFTPSDGAFTYYLPAWNAHSEITLYVSARGYASVSAPVTFDGEDVCDLGTLVLREESASVRGRVINQDGEPVAANVFTMVYGDARQATRLSVRANPEDGRFSFTDLPIASMQVEARTPLASVSSEQFTPRAGQTYEVPDLVLITTNGARVRLTFVLPDGAPAAGMYVERFQASTDARGAITVWVKPGRFNNLRVLSAFAYQNSSVNAYPTQGAIIYYAEAFTVNADTRELTVRLYNTATIEGMVYLDERPYNGSLSFQTVPRGPLVSTIVREGAFSASMRAGRYIAVSRAWHTAAPCELRPQQDNVVHLRSGAGTLTVYYPWPGTWNCSALLQVNGMFVNVAGGGFEAGVTQTQFAEMPGGEYQLTARCSDAAHTTNMSMRVYLSEGASMSVAFR